MVYVNAAKIKNSFAGEITHSAEVLEFEVGGTYDELFQEPEDVEGRVLLLNWQKNWLFRKSLQIERGMFKIPIDFYLWDDTINYVSIKILRGKNEVHINRRRHHDARTF